MPRGSRTWLRTPPSNRPNALLAPILVMGKGSPDEGPTRLRCFPRRDLTGLISQNGYSPRIRAVSPSAIPSHPVSPRVIVADRAGPLLAALPWLDGASQE